MSFSDSERQRLDDLVQVAAHRAARETTQHLDGTVHLQTTNSLSPSTLTAIVALLVTVFGGMAGIYATGRSIDATHEQRIVALERIAASDRAELIAEIRGLRRELQEAIEKLDSKIERRVLK